jgi:predicted DNA-binding transcriptional regulator YafY
MTRGASGVWLRAVSRLGLVCRGTVYLLVGYLALRLALAAHGRTGAPASSAGAVQAASAWGRVPLVLLVAAVAVQSATAKVHRVLPRALAGRLGALVAATWHADEGRAAATPETGVLLTVAQAAVRRRPLAITYRDKKDRPTERVLEPYGVVARRGRWYATGPDPRSGQVRSLRLDRVAHAAVREGQLPVPGGFDPAAQVAEAVPGASYRHAVWVRVQGSERVVRMRMPGSIATIEPVNGEPGWVRVRSRAQRLDWIPPVLAGLDRPFAIEEPDEPRQRARALAEQLGSWAEAR